MEAVEGKTDVEVERVAGGDATVRQTILKIT
jgi:hypothetical protein